MKKHKPRYVVVLKESDFDLVMTSIERTSMDTCLPQVERQRFAHLADRLRDQTYEDPMHAHRL